MSRKDRQIKWSDLADEIASTVDSERIAVDRKMSSNFVLTKRTKLKVTHTLGLLLIGGFILFHTISMLFVCIKADSTDEVVSFVNNYRDIWATVLGFVLGFYFSDKS